MVSGSALALLCPTIIFTSAKAEFPTFVWNVTVAPGCDCAEILQLIEEGKIDTTPLITHRFALNEIEEAYRVFENKLDGVIKIAIY